MEEPSTQISEPSSTNPDFLPGSSVSSASHSDDLHSNKDSIPSKTVLCVWEMGGNLGHLTNLKLFAEQALKCGYRVHLAVRELLHIPKFFNELEVEVWQAPHLRIPLSGDSGPMLSYTEMVVKQCFSSIEQLEVLVSAWQQIFQTIRPDVVIYDHSPSALIASSGEPWKKWVIGSGFLIPRTDSGFFGVFPDVRKSPDHDRRLAEMDEHALTMINSVLKNQGRSPWWNLSEWFRQCDRKLLLTIPETDHFGGRKNANYLGLYSPLQGVEPRWLYHHECGDSEATERPKAFVYVNDFSGLEALLDSLSKKARVLVYCKTLPVEIQKKFTGRVAFASGPVDMSALLKHRCYFVTNGNHATVVQSLVEGLPQLLIPLQREQYLLSLRIKRLGRGVMAPVQLKSFDAAVEALLDLEFVDPKNSGVSDETQLKQQILEYFRAELVSSVKSE